MVYRLVIYLFFFTLCSCAILSRDAGFTRPEDFKSGFIFEVRPNTSLSTGSYSSPALKVNQEESVSIYVTVENRATMEYSFGPLLPIIPIFWMKGFKSGLSEGEKLRIRCHVQFSPGRKYLVPSKNNPGYFQSTPEAAKAVEARNAKGKDRCVGLAIYTSNDTKVLPVSGPDEDSLFVFDIDAIKLSKFTFKVPQVRLVDGNLIDVNLSGTFQAYDFKRYQLTSPN
ncbi:MAG: hypothetical protein KF865_12580 [Bdellovibrionaceae bacterium]|nr:hypothetical protein [Pseudobdellovibrionaceae bacterium]